jgi:hypothetical protein
MIQSRTISFIKFIHYFVFVFMVACILYILYCAATRTYNWELVIALAAIFGEGFALLVNRWRCPLTTLAERCGSTSGSIIDEFLPDWLAPHMFSIGTTVFIIELIWLGIGYFIL